MLKNWLESFYENSSPLVLTSVFLSVLAPSVLLLYTGTYNIWFHAVFLYIVTGCYIALLLHLKGFKARIERMENDDEQKDSNSSLNKESSVKTSMAALEDDFQRAVEELKEKQSTTAQHN